MQVEHQLVAHRHLIIRQHIAARKLCYHVEHLLLTIDFNHMSRQQNAISKPQIATLSYEQQPLIQKCQPLNYKWRTLDYELWP